MKSESNTTFLVKVNGLDFNLSKKQYEIYENVRKEIKEKNKIQQDVLKKVFIVKKSSNKEVTSSEMNRLFELDKNWESNKSTLSQILRIAVYANLGMNGKVESLINGILEKEIFEDFFILDPINSKEIKITEIIVDVLKDLQDQFDDKKLFNTLIAYLVYGIDTPVRDLYISEFDVPNRLSYVQEKVKSINYGQLYPFTWSLWLEKFSSQIELENYLLKTQFYEKLKNGKIRRLGLMQSYFPKTKDERDILLTAYQQLSKSKDAFEKDLRFRLHLNEDFDKFLLRFNEQKKPLFVEQRNFYKMLLDENKAMTYALFNLIKLGDIHEDYLIKALALNSYGL